MFRQTYQIRGTVVGLAVTTLAVTLLLTGGFDWAENVALDFRQRYANTLTTAEEIVHVDIDDSSLEKVGRWPWRRDITADLVRIIAEAGAKTIAIDLLFEEEQKWTVDRPDLEAQESGGKTAGELSEANFVEPDWELADAIRRAGNVYLSMRYEDPPPIHVRVREWLARDSTVTPQAAAKELHVDPAIAADAWARCRLAARLADDFDLDRDPRMLEAAWAPIREAIAGLTSRIDVDEVLAGALRDAALIRARMAWRDMPPGSQPSTQDMSQELLRQLGLTTEHYGARYKEIELAVARRLSALTARAKNPSWPAGLDAHRITSATEPVGPVYEVARAARGFGAVAVESEKDRDGFMRRVSLIVNHEGRLLRQLGFAVAADVLKLDMATLQMRPDGGLTMVSRSGQRYSVPLDARGRMILHWSVTGRFWRQGRDSVHVPAAAVLQVAYDRRAIERNQQNINIHMADIVSAVKPTVLVDGRPRDTRADWLSKVETLQRKSRALHALRLRGEDEAPEYATLTFEATALRDEIDATQRQCSEAVRLAVRDFDEEMKELEAELSGDELEKERAALAADCRKFTDAARLLDGLIAELQRENERLAKTSRDTLDRLRKRLTEKYVFIGFTATAHGDVVPTAIDSSLPGVMAHSTVLNNFLSRRFISLPNRSTEALIVIVLGLTATIITATRPIGSAIVVVVLLMAAYLTTNMFLLFMPLDLKIELVAVATAIVSSAVPVGYYRWRVSERQRREIRSAFGQYTSPALASRIADEARDVAALMRVENREVTCFFSDLKGFTTMAEQVDPERTRAALNIYLDRMSEALDRHSALINKFMGDGIFAFFNASVLPRSDHPRAACEAALDCLAALDALKREHAAGSADDLVQHFEMRIGVASGVAGVGDFGSSRKRDYTVIGDVANLAARLEPANKVFGTTILVSGLTRDAVDGAYEFRYLAELQVKGKLRTVPVYELMGRKGSVPHDRREWADAFARGVELYKQRQWDECIAHFRALDARRPGDAGAALYITACEERKRVPPGTEWTGALELKEK